MSLELETDTRARETDPSWVNEESRAAAHERFDQWANQRWADYPGNPGETHPSRVRPTQDNVLLYLKPLPERATPGSLLVLPGNRKERPTGAREAIVLATGPGWRLRDGRGPLVPTEVQPGQCVVVDAKAGQDWSLDVAKPRTNPVGCQWDSFPVPTHLERPGGEYRMVRADEILFELPDQKPEDEALELDYGDLVQRR